jgi:hypothetical protein
VHWHSRFQPLNGEQAKADSADQYGSERGDDLAADAELVEQMNHVASPVGMLVASRNASSGDSGRAVRGCLNQVQTTSDLDGRYLHWPLREGEDAAV